MKISKDKSVKNPIVNTTAGPVRGEHRKKCDRWLGIPYAKPPVGDLRFKRSIQADAWEGVRDCLKFGAGPEQMAGGRFQALSDIDNKKSEDCLYLNVWAPKGSAVGAGTARQAPDRRSAANAAAPVFIWIYGGGQHAGDASAPEYDLESFARRGIVAVSFNYRLGALGFYDFRDAAENKAAFDSNCGVSDMILALKWVHENIAAFGGDPENVTMAGESAGGTAVMALLCAPTARPLFKRAIIMSGIASNITRETTQEINNKKFFEWAGIDAGDADLKTMPVENIKKGCAAFFTTEDNVTPGIMVSGPVIDDLVTETPEEMFRRGGAGDKQIMFGTCADEGGLFSFLKICPRKWDEIETMLRFNHYEELIPEFHRVYGGKQAEAVKAINRDRMFWADTMKCAIAQSAYSRTYMYRFNFVTGMSRALKMGATHSMDVCPALNTYEGAMSSLYKGVPPKKLRKLHAEMHGSFVNFIKYGTPRLKGWKPFTAENWETFVFSRSSHAESRAFEADAAAEPAAEIGKTAEGGQSVKTTETGNAEERYRLWENIKLY
ncbi:MAG: carboxylesterase family protein [Eubacteriales bacterium]|nr:carboxylesterase family protein [Eubacteriales bacterium]